jgi:predicted RND superfamily exporter protein
MHNFRRFHDASGEVRVAVRKTLSSTGQALLFTSLALSGGFLVYCFAGLNVLFHFGILTAFTIAMAFVADIVLAPALLALAVRPPAVPDAGMEVSR